MHRYAALISVLLGYCGTLHADDWPQWLGPQRDGIWRETGILETFPAQGPNTRWRTPVGMGYSGPAVSGGRVYLTDRILPPGVKNPSDPFARTKVPGNERVLCLDEATGKVNWQHAYDCTYQIAYPAGPRTTPVVSGGKVYTLGAMGDLLCLDARDGKVLWSRNFPRDYDARVPLWGFSASPLLDGNKLICLVGADQALAIAFDRDTGKELWRALNASEPGYCPPVIFDVGGKRQLIIWHPEAVNSLDPETGKVYWSEKFAVKAGLTVPTPRFDGERLLLSCFYNGSMMLKLAKDPPAASVLWKVHGRSEYPQDTEGLQGIMSTPFLKDGYFYGVCSYGELRCLKADTGERVWSTLKATGNRDKPDERWANAFLVLHGDRFFLSNEKGDLIIARLTPAGYEEISRAHILEPTGLINGRLVNWSHPAYADRCIFARNDKEIVCVSLAANEK